MSAEPNSKKRGHTTLTLAEEEEERRRVFDGSTVDVHRTETVDPLDAEMMRTVSARHNAPRWSKDNMDGIPLEHLAAMAALDPCDVQALGGIANMEGAFPPARAYILKMREETEAGRRVDVLMTGMTPSLIRSLPLLRICGEYVPFFEPATSAYTTLTVIREALAATAPCPNERELDAVADTGGNILFNAEGLMTIGQAREVASQMVAAVRGFTPNIDDPQADAQFYEQIAEMRNAISLWIFTSLVLRNSGQPSPLDEEHIVQSVPEKVWVRPNDFQYMRFPMGEQEPREDGALCKLVPYHAVPLWFAGEWVKLFTANNMPNVLPVWIDGDMLQGALTRMCIMSLKLSTHNTLASVKKAAMDFSNRMLALDTLSDDEFVEIAQALHKFAAETTEKILGITQNTIVDMARVVIRGDVVANFCASPEILGATYVMEEGHDCLPFTTDPLPDDKTGVPRAIHLPKLASDKLTALVNAGMSTFTTYLRANPDSKKVCDAVLARAFSLQERLAQFSPVTQAPVVYTLLHYLTIHVLNLRYEQTEASVDDFAGFYDIAKHAMAQTIANGRPMQVASVETSSVYRENKRRRC